MRLRVIGPRRHDATMPFCCFLQVNLSDASLLSIHSCTNYLSSSRAVGLLITPRIITLNATMIRSSFDLQVPRSTAWGRKLGHITMTPFSGATENLPMLCIFISEKDGSSMRAPGLGSAHMVVPASFGAVT